MSLISKETLLTHLQRAEMASDVRLPIEFFRDLVYQAMPRTWVGLTREDRFQIQKDMSKYYDYQHECKTVCLPEFAEAIEAKLKEKNGA
jgi:hypothetical protein